MENIDDVLLRVAHDREGVTWDWLERCEQFVGTWTPADHVYFLHGSEDVKQDQYVTIARSNAHGLQNDVDGAFEAELKADNQRRDKRELREYEVAQADGRKMRKPRLQSNINWVQDSIPVSCFHDAHERSAFNLMYEDSFDDLCDAVLPLTREEYRLQQEKENHEKQKKSAQYESRQSNRPDGYKKNSYEVILSDLRKLSILKRFASGTAGLRDKFLFNFTVACSWCMHVSQIRDELHKLCSQMKLNLDEFWSYLQSVFMRIEKGIRHKYQKCM